MMILDTILIIGIPGQLKKDNFLYMKDYIYLKYKDTINKGFQKLKGKFGGIIFIIDNNKKLLGTVSEGDLRRSILKGNPADTQIGNIMNRNPTFVYSNELKSKFLKRSDINLGKALDRTLVIPVVDKNKKLLSIISSEEFINLFSKLAYCCKLICFSFFE